VARAQQGDRRAFEALYRHYAPTLFSYVLVPILGDRDEAQDCLRETFIAAHKALPAYEWREPSIWPWLKVLAKNKARDLLRAAGRRSRLRGAFAEQVDLLIGEDETTTAAEELVRHWALRARIEQVLAEIHPRYAAVLRLRLLDEVPRERCAELLDVKVGNLDVLLHRACKAFKKACEGVGLELEVLP